MSKCLSALVAGQAYGVSGTGSAQVIGYVDMSAYDCLLCVVSNSLSVDTGIDAFILRGATSDAGAGAVTLATHAIDDAYDDDSDNLVLEVTTDDLVNAGQSIRYVSAVVTAANVHVYAVTYIRGFPKYAKTGLTANVLA